MRPILTAICFLLLVPVIGCWPSHEPAETETATESGSRESKEVDLSSLRYDTGDVKEWPDYHLPSQHTLDVPEVPPEIVGPFSADDLPEKPE